MPYTIVLTGTIASGKSTATAFFKQKGIDIISADDVARALTQPNTPALDAIAAHFGQSILTPDGALDRRALREVIMRHPDEKKWLEAYLHPQIRAAIEKELANTQSPYVIIEIPLLTRREDFPYLNEVLLLEVAPNIQIERLMARDQCTEAEAKAMINIQPCHTTRRALADDVLQNDDDTTRFEAALDALHHRYLKVTNQK